MSSSLYGKKIDTQLLWSNVLDDDELAELKTAASYLIKDNKQHSLFDPCTPLLADEKLFYAERYGGGAISRNGGGARCGFDGRWQVKGIGANALVGRGSKQVDGELTLTGAVLEALWGNLMPSCFHMVLYPIKRYYWLTISALKMRHRRRQRCMSVGLYWCANP